MANAVDLGVDDVLSVVQNIYGIEGVVCDTNKGPQYKFLCVAHDDCNPSADVHLETGIFNCWSCRASGDLLTLGKLATGKSRAELRSLLRPNNPSAKAAAIARRSKAARSLLGGSKPPSAAMPAQVRQHYPKTKGCDYLTNRGFSRETLLRWRIRFVPQDKLYRNDGSSFEIKNVFAIPIRLENGELAGWCYRATPDSPKWLQEVRYLYTPGITGVLNKTWFGLYEHRNEKHITVTEGALDAIWLDQCGIPAVAMLGSQAKQVAKIRKLMRFKKVTLFLDRDETGVQITNYLGLELQKRGVSVFVARFAPFMVKEGKPAKDAQDLCPLDVELCHTRAVSFSHWRMADHRPELT